jgi:hypothetical protein
MTTLPHLPPLWVRPDFAALISSTEHNNRERRLRVKMSTPTRVGVFNEDRDTLPVPPEGVTLDDVAIWLHTQHGWPAARIQLVFEYSPPGAEEDRYLAACTIQPVANAQLVPVGGAAAAQPAPPGVLERIVEHPEMIVSWLQTLDTLSVSAPRIARNMGLVSRAYDEGRGVLTPAPEQPAQAPAPRTPAPPQAQAPQARQPTEAEIVAARFQDAMRTQQEQINAILAQSEAQREALERQVQTMEAQAKVIGQLMDRIIPAAPVVPPAAPPQAAPVAPPQATAQQFQRRHEEEVEEEVVEEVEERAGW